jgi:hypothetical protein
MTNSDKPNRWKKIISITGGGLILLFTIIQFVPAERTNPPVTADIDASLEVKRILKQSCYDCHSNETKWPWYSNVAPVSWLVAHDVKEGREHLNFSEWGMLSNDKKHALAEEAWEEVEDGEMPLKIYLIMHGGAKLSESDRQALRNWAGEPEETEHEEETEH